MPWMETDAMKERAKFVVDVRERGLEVAEACRRHGVSRPTGYKWLKRYDDGGFEALVDRSRAPHGRPNTMAPEVAERLLALKDQYRSWGPKKLRALLAAREPELKVPAASTIGELLDRNGLVEKRESRLRSAVSTTTPLSHADRPNALWSADFKGQFRLGDGSYCYPLTVTDNCSRFILVCEALTSTQGESARPAFEQAFERYGLPVAIRTDNGAPFATVGPGGLSELSAWWLRLGIGHERIVPGHPEQNGRHERMHLTLKRETTRPAGADQAEQQARFVRYVKEFNNERPHQALDQKTPASVHEVSTRPYPTELPEPDYSDYDFVGQVRTNGQVPFAGSNVNVGKALAEQTVGFLELDDDCWLVGFCGLELGFFKRGAFRLVPIEEPGRHWRENRV